MINRCRNGKENLKILFSKVSWKKWGVYFRSDYNLNNLFNSGWPEWKLEKCCKNNDVSVKCRAMICHGECKEQAGNLYGNGTGNQECDKYIDGVSSCCGANWITMN